MNLNFSGVLKEVRTRAANVNLNCEFERGLKTPYAAVSPDGTYTKIVVPMPDPMWDKDKWDLWWYMLEHELGHIVPAMLDAYDVLKSKNIKPDSFIGYGLNLLEDHRQEWYEYDRYAGRKRRLDRGRRLFLDSQDFAKNGQSSADAHRLAGETLYAWDTFERECFMPSVIGKGDEIASYFTDQQLEWLEKLATGDYGNILKSGITAWEEYDLLIRIIDEVFEFDSEQEEQDAQQQPTQEQEAEGEGEEGAAEDGDGNAKGKVGDVEGDEEGESQGGTVDYSDLLAHQHEETKGGKDGFAGLHINYDSNTGVFLPVDPSTIKIIDYTDGSEEVKMDGEYFREISRVSQSGDGLAKHVRRLLQAKSVSKYQHGLKRGKVSPKSIFRGGMKNTGSYQQKIFRKKQEVDILNTSVTVLVDASGSMSGRKYVHAGASAVLLNTAISSIGVPLEIVGFDDGWSAPQHAILKTFSKSVTSEELVGRISTAADRLMNSNSDGESIMWAYDRLTKRKERRKIMIVLSDGSPATNRGDADAYTKDVIKSIESSGVVEIYGIGIMDRNVTRLYKDNHVIRSATELETALLNVIEHKILS